jgi:molecular chaperone DnaJ
MAADHYATLGVAADASQEEIKRAFRQLARTYHPDANDGDPEAERRYKEISEAYSVLSDPGRRRQYDGARLGGGDWSPFATTIEDIFDSFFGGGRGTTAGPRTRAQPGESLETDVELRLEEAVFGTERTLRVRRHEPCAACDATGCAAGSHPVRCQACAGSGQVQQARRTILGSMVTAFPCRQCGQTGWVVPTPCRDCTGTGRVVHDVEVPIEFPAGIDRGDGLRLRGEGSVGIAGGGRGDLYVRIDVLSDERFERNGDDLITWAEIPLVTAALGGEVRFESLDGEEVLDVPRGTQSGATFTIRGRGAGRRSGRGRGELVVHAHVATPTGLDGEQEELLRRLADMRGETADGGKGFIRTLRRVFGAED